MTGATDGSMPVGSVRFLSARFPASLIRRSRIRPLDRFISSYVPELRWQQALPPDCGADPFGSAFCTRSFTLENLADKVGSALALQHNIPRPRDTLFPARHSLFFSLINRFSKYFFSSDVPSSQYTFLDARCNCSQRTHPRQSKETRKPTRPYAISTPSPGLTRR